MSSPEARKKQNENNAIKLKKYLENLDKAKRLTAAVGLPQEKVGGEVYGNGKTVLEIGASQEYGASINHPGGTPYKITKSGATFVKKGTKGASGVTKAHKIIIPSRSFLRTPFIIKKTEIAKFINIQFKRVLEMGLDAEIAIGRIGAFAQKISFESFSNNGYGQWAPLKASTKRKKKSSTPLVDTGTLRNSITFAVRKK